jgi:[ribosomal protein S5]-alanine N-acetyltransferase
MINTPRLRFRNYRIEDADALFEVFNDPYTYQFYPQMREMSAVKKWIEWNLETYAMYEFCLWALEDISSGKLIGDCGLTYQEIDGKQCLEIGYHIHPAYQKQGLALEAARAVLTYAVVSLHPPFICSIVDKDNIASQKVASKLFPSKRLCQYKGKEMILYYLETHNTTESLAFT